jgi:hypothetical protein
MINSHGPTRFPFFEQPSADNGRPDRPCVVPADSWELAPDLTLEEDMEFLNFVLMFTAAYILLRRPERERLAFRLLVISVVLMVLLFSIATRTSLLPGVNY